MGHATPEDTTELRRRFRTAFQTQNAAGRTTDSIAAELGVNPSTCRNWAKGLALPPPPQVG